MIFAALSIAAGILITLTLLPLLNFPAWWIRGCAFPRLQICALLFFVLALELWLLDFSLVRTWFLVLVTSACLIYQVWWIAPYTRLFPVEVKLVSHRDATDKIRILAANVLGTNRESAKFLQLVRESDPDILVTLESNAWWEKQLAVLEHEYPWTIKCPLENLYGMHVYSRLPLEDSEIKFLVEPDVPSAHTKALLRNGQRICMHFLHPKPPSPLNQSSLERDVELLIVARDLDGASDPTIVAGDLNDVAWSKTTRMFRRVSGLLDPRVGRGMFNTFHADYWFIRWPLDHLFHSRHFVLSDIRRLPAFGSDHFPVLMELVYDKQQEAMQAGLEPEPGDKAHARRKIGQLDHESRRSIN